MEASRGKKQGRNITNGQVHLNVDPEDLAGDDTHFIRLGGVDPRLLSGQVSQDKSYTFLENLRTGDFTQISENYLVREPDQPTIYTADSFETEMYQLIHTMGNLVSKMVFFFQGILAGLTLLQILTLRLSPTNFSEQIGRIDQCIRIACFVSTFGSFYLLVSNRRTYNSLTIKATATELNQSRRLYLQSLISFIIYFICYVLVIISHESVVRYNLQPVLYVSFYQKSWSNLSIAYTLFAFIGWILAVNSAKSTVQTIQQ